jgi:hypothetical protein
MCADHSLSQRKSEPPAGVTDRSTPATRCECHEALHFNVADHALRLG